jgi:hypothetical protein
LGAFSFNMQPIKIKIEPKLDTDKQVYYLGKLKVPMDLRFDKGVAFMVYLDYVQELHIAPMTSPDLIDVFEYYDVGRKKIIKHRHNNIVVHLNPRFEKQDPNDPKKVPRKFYVGKIQADIRLRFDEGIAFLIFISDHGEEELQIASVDKRNEKG